MLIRPIEVDDLRARISAGRAFEVYAGATSISLGGAIELACAFEAAQQQSRLKEFIHESAARLPVLAEALRVFEGASFDRRSQWGTANWELHRIAGAEEWLGDDGLDFQQRFARSISQYTGLELKAARQFSKALGEMTSNVLEHSGESENAPALALVGYHVAPGWLSFTVGDLGRGVLASLRTRSEYQTVTSSTDALWRAVCENATRKASETHGTGFQTVQRSLASRNGRVRFRSGDASLTLDGTTRSPKWIRAESPSLVGLQLTVICSTSGKPDPRPVGSQ